VSDLEDRRDAPRAPIELKVEYERLNAFFADYTKNICRGGTFVRTNRPLDIGTEFIFKLGVPTLEEPLVLTGAVQWVLWEGEATGEQEPGMGIRFVFQDDSERERVEATVQGLMEREFGELVTGKLLARRSAS
jgi:type IV pilus assembly protein PilZ